MGKIRGKTITTKRKLNSMLNNKQISDQNHKHAQGVWDLFNMKKKIDYVYIYDGQDILAPLGFDIDLSKNASA